MTHHHVADYRVGVVEVKCNVAEDYLFHVSNYCLDAPFLIWREAFHTYSFVNALCGCDEDTNGLSVGRSIGGSPTINNETITVIDGLVLPALSSWISFFIQSKTKTMVVYTFCALMLCSVQSFSPGKALLDHHHHRRPSPSPSLLKQSSTPNELFDSPGWESIKLELDQVPVFSVANAEGQPIK